MRVVRGKKIAQTTKLTLISFLGLIIIGGILLNLPIANMPGKPHDLLNSFFTATASVCVAGLSTVTAGEQYTLFGKIVMLILIQIGALGLIFIMSSFVLLVKHKLTFKEQINIGTILGTPEKLNEIKVLVRRIVKFTFITEVMGAVFLCIRFVPMFGPLNGAGQAIFTSVSSFCNCGYDLLGNNSLINYATDYLVVGVCGLLTIMGSLGFVVWNEIFEKYKTKKKNHLSFRKTWLTFSTHTKLVFTMLIVMLVFGTFGIMVFEYNNPATLGEYSFFEKLFISLFQGVSARTTGMTTINLMEMTNSGKFFTMILMLIGGAPGSTAGGIKTVTFAVLIITMISSISNNKFVNVFRREISDETIKQSTAVLISALIIISCTTMVLSALNPQIAFIDMMFEVISALATCGYSLGITAGLTVTSKAILIIIMYIGRVSTVTMAMWVAGKKFKQNNSISYPKADINVG